MIFWRKYYIRTVPSLFFTRPTARQVRPLPFLLHLKPKEIVLSKPSEKKVEVAVVSSVVSSKNYSSSSATTNPRQNFTAEKNLSAGEAGLSSVITIGEKNNSSAKIWLILAAITGIIGGAGVFIARKI